MENKQKGGFPILCASSILGEIYNAAHGNIAFSSVIELARLAYFHLVQLELWFWYDKTQKKSKSARVTGIVVYSFGECSSPSLKLYFEDGGTMESHFEHDCPSQDEFEIRAQEMIFDYGLEREIEIKKGDVQEGK